MIQNTNLEIWLFLIISAAIVSYRGCKMVRANERRKRGVMDERRS